MIDFLNGYGPALEKAQKSIDSCNEKCGCNSKCSVDEQNRCELRKRHRELIHMMVSGEEK